MAPKAVIEFSLNQLTGSNSMRSTEELTSRSNSWLDSLTSDVGNFLGDIEKNISNAFTHGIDSVVGDAVATAKRQLNISDWYSLHVLGTCQGDYTPNATVSNPGRRTKGCREDVRRELFSSYSSAALISNCLLLRSFQHCRGTGPAVSNR